MAAKTWDAEAVKSAKVSIRRRLLETRTRLDELFRDFDGHNSKKVSHAQALRAFDRLGARLTTREADAVLERWSNGDGLFCYVDFADFMDKVFTRKGLEANPDAKLTNPMGGRPLHTYGEAKLTEEEAGQLGSLLDTAAATVASKGLIVKNFFLDYDRRGNGYCNRSQFSRGMLAAFPSMTDAEIGLLARRYADEGGDVNYKALHIDVTPDAVAPGRSSWSTPGNLSRTSFIPGSGDAASAIEDRLVRECSSKRIRPQEFFRDFDPKRTGYCSRQQFKRGLFNCGFSELADGDMNALAESYWNAEKGLVRFSDFTDKMDEAFTAKGLERAPTATLDSHARAVAKAPRRVAPAMSPAQQKAVDAALSTITHAIVTRNFELKWFFKDFDRTNEECVTRPQFMRVLKQLGILPPPHELEPLLLRFAAPGGRSKTHVDWRSFYQAVEPPDAFAKDEARAKAAAATGARLVPISAPAADDRVALEKALHRIKLQARKGQVRVHEFFRDFDKLGSGRVTRHQFDVALSNARLMVSPKEVEALCDLYAAPGGVVDSAGDPMVAWRTFSDDVDAIFTVKGLETNPLADAGSSVASALYRTGTLAARTDVEDGKAPSAEPTGARGRLSEDEESKLRDLLETLDEAVRTRRLELPTHFREFDRHNRGVLTADNFNRALDRVGLALDRIPLALVAKAFAVPCAEVGRRDVNYRWFYKALDNVDGVLGNLPEADAAPTVSIAKLRSAEESKSGLPASAVMPSRAPTSEGGDAVAAVEALQEECARKRVRLTTFLQDSDRLRLGRISKAKFRSSLAAAGLSMTEAELTALERSYVHDADATMIAWRDLAHLVDGGDEAMERDPSATTRKFTARVYTEADSGVDADQLNLVLKTLKHFVKERGTLMKPTFQGFDRLRKNRVTRAQFASVCQTLKLPIGVADNRILCDAFAVRGTTDLVNYLNFLRRIDDSEL